MDSFSNGGDTRCGRVTLDKARYALRTEPLSCPAKRVAEMPLVVLTPCKH